MTDRTAPAAPPAVPGTGVPFSAVPAPVGLYDPANDRDACGVAFVAVEPDQHLSTWDGVVASSRPGSPRCTTSTTAARPARSRTPATAPGS